MSEEKEAMLISSGAYLGESFQICPACRIKGEYKEEILPDGSVVGNAYCQNCKLTFYTTRRISMLRPHPIEPRPINMHDGHQATCLCCEWMKMDEDPGYSELTPGDGYSAGCRRNHWHTGDADPEATHGFCNLGLKCVDFEAREAK